MSRTATSPIAKQRETKMTTYSDAQHAPSRSAYIGQGTWGGVRAANAHAPLTPAPLLTPAPTPHATPTPHASPAAALASPSAPGLSAMGCPASTAHCCRLVGRGRPDASHAA